MNPWKWLVIGWAAHKGFVLARKLRRARRIAKKQVIPSIVEKYNDL